MTLLLDRRLNRSSRPYDAVIKQLQAIVSDGGFQNMLIADDEGLVIAADREDPANEKLGVACQLLMRQREHREEHLGKTFVVRSGNQRHTMLIHRFILLDEPVFLVARRADEQSAHPYIQRAVEGAKRILEC